MTDPIADMLTRIRNAFAVKKQEVVLPYSRFKFDLAKVFEKKKKIKKVEIVKIILDKESKKESKFKQIKLVLVYDQDGEPTMKMIKRISTPGQRIYVKRDRIPFVLNGLGFCVLSTSHGLMTGNDARKKKLGGELICEIW